MDRRSNGIILILLVLVFNATVQAASWIEDFDGPPGTYQLERGGQSMPVKIYQELQTGDPLHVLKKTTHCR